MSSVNSVSLLGRLGKDPELTYIASGTACCKFSLATTKLMKDKEGNRTSVPVWHQIVVWGRQAESCDKYLSKGSTAYIDGEIEYQEWDGNDGTRKYRTVINGRNVQFIGGAKVKQEEAEGTLKQPQQEDKSYSVADIPF